VTAFRPESPDIKKEPANGFRAVKFYTRFSKVQAFVKIAKLAYAQTVAIFTNVLFQTG
jgi:hypothetical protein